MRTTNDVVDRLRRPVDHVEYEAIRRLWTAHSMAEDARDIQGLMATLTDDCTYVVENKGVSWTGKQGATEFYRQLLTAFPDIHFDLQDIVIGPQGVFERARVTATHQLAWLDVPATGGPVEFDVLILFPWDPVQRLFTGEHVWVFERDR